MLANNALLSNAMTLSQIAKTIDMTPLVNQLIGSFEALSDAKKWAEQSLGTMSGIVKDVQARASLVANAAALLNSSFLASEVTNKLYSSDLIQAAADLAVPQISIRQNVVVPPMIDAVLLGTVRHAGFRDSRNDLERDLRESIVVAHSEVNHVEIYLHAIHPRFVAQWRGCWEALESENPDRLRQAAHSGRELLNQVLEFLAPDVLFTPEELKLHHLEGKRPSRKLRAAKILNAKTSSSDIEVINAIAATFEALADTCGKLYDSLSARAHDRSEVISDTEVRGYLIVLGGALIILLGD